METADINKIEARTRERISSISETLKVRLDNLRKDGISERAQAACLAAIEDLISLMTSANFLKAEDKENFILEVRNAIRILTHGMTIGEVVDRNQEQLNIANNKGELGKQISEALRRANGTGKTGGQGTVAASESQI